MKNVKGIWLPDHEQYLLDFAKDSNWTYQKNRLDLAIKYVDKFDLCIDIGAHCGLWSMHLTKLFNHVHAFEPVQEHIECFNKNINNTNYTLHSYALGDKDKTISMHTTSGTSVDSWVIEDGNDIICKPLDSFNLKPNFIKIDVERYEYYILLGAEETIKKHKPTIIVEIIPFTLFTTKRKEYVVNHKKVFNLLKNWGYILRDQRRDDYIFTHQKH